MSYIGTAYNGWQNQPHAGTVTVQGTLESSMSQYLRIPISLTGCGRTDTGVHAQDYFAHFDTMDLIDDIPTMVHRLNKILPVDIAVHDVISVTEGVHARFDAISRSYKYHIHTSKDPFQVNSMYYPYKNIDINTLNEAARLINGSQNFSTFCKKHSDVNNMNCHVTESYWLQSGDTYTFHISADRFLRGMIRLIVGMCLNVCSGKLTLDQVKTAIDSGDRTGHDWSVPAVGLVLCDIKYLFLMK